MKLKMVFDKLLYDGGLISIGKLKCHCRGKEHFKISKYSDLDELLVENWHIKGLNTTGDHAYAILDSIFLYIRKKRPLKEFVPLEDGTVKKRLQEQGWILVFCFL